MQCCFALHHARDDRKLSMRLPLPETRRVRCRLLVLAVTLSRLHLADEIRDLAADVVGMILLQVMRAGAEIHQAAIVQALREILREGGETRAPGSPKNGSFG